MEVKQKKNKTKPKTFLTVFPHTILYLGVTKPFQFKNKFLWEMKNGYCTIMQNRRDKEQLKWKTTNRTKAQSSSKEVDDVYMVRLEGCPLLWAPSGKIND